MEIGEFELIENIRRRFPVIDTHAEGIGDDCAIINGKELWCTDAMVDGVHFRSERDNMADIAYKSMAVNVSDIVAMGGFPEHALLTLGLPANTEKKHTQSMMDGIETARREFHFDLIGGDTVSSPVFFLSVSMKGSVYRNILRRNSAVSGDIIYVSGTLGDSAIGLGLLENSLEMKVSDTMFFKMRHYSPTPRLNLMAYLQKTYKLHACIDVSDGFGADLMHIARDSGLGFTLEWSKLPVNRTKIGAAFEERPEFFFEKAMNGGEDYEFILTSADSIDVEKVYAATGVMLTPIGRMTDEGFKILYYDEEKDVNKIIHGFSHF